MKVNVACLAWSVLASGYAMAAADPAAETTAPSASLLALIVPLMAVVFAVVALWWILRRHNAKGGHAGPARVVQVIGVGPRERIVIVDHDRQRVMLGVTQTSITLLTHLDPQNAAKIHENASGSMNADSAPTRR